MSGVIEAVLFDLDDTLLDGDTAGEAGLRTLLTRCPAVAWDAAVAAWDLAFREHFPPFLRGEMTMAQSRAARLRAWADQLAVPVDAGSEAAWFDWYLAGYESGWTRFDDVLACLDALAGLRLGVITNGEGEQQRAKLTALGLDDRFEIVIASADVGFAKPDARIFRLAATALGVPLERSLFIGDNRLGDAVGAQAAGMRGVWLNRRGEPAPDDLVPQIASLAELPALVLAEPGERAAGPAEAAG
jgi:putative hydrolase of the HAD superfamily